MQKLTILILAVCFISIFLGLMPVHGENEVYDSVLRLHVLANSDSDVDQELKLKVRDAVLEESGDMFKDCKTRDEAIEKLQSELPKIQEIAEKTIADEYLDHHHLDPARQPCHSHEPRGAVRCSKGSQR